MPPVTAARQAQLDAKEALYKLITKQKNAGVAQMGALIAQIPVADLNSQYKTGKTLLTKAIDMKALETIKLLIAAGVDPNVFQPRTTMPPQEEVSYLNEAVTSTPEILAYFLTLGINVNKGWEPPILIAARDTKKGIELVKQLIAAGADVNKQGGVYNKSALMEACSSNNSKLVNYLLLPAVGANIRAVSENNRNALFSCDLPRSLEIFKSLVAAGLDINSTDGTGKTPLYNYFASFHIFTKFLPTVHVVNYFAANGARFDTVAGGGNLFHHCAHHHVDLTRAGAHESILRILGERGVPVNAPNGSNQTPLLVLLSSVKRNGHGDSAYHFLKQLLKVPGIDVNISGKMEGGFENIPPIMYAAWMGFFNVAEMILDAGADITQMNDKGDTILHYLARCRGVPDSIWTKILTNPNFDVEVKNFANGELRPLHMAAQKSMHLNNVKKLVEFMGADVNARDANGHTPAYHAAFTRNKEGLEYLLRLPTIDKKILYNATAGRAGQTLYDVALAGVHFKDADIIELITELCGPAAAPQQMWTGWSRADAAGFQSIFEDDYVEEGSEKKPAVDTSVCPVCLKTVTRIDGCVYIQDHNCSQLEGFYHKELYEKYKMETGGITWCTICGRICGGHKGHQHYKLGSATGDKPGLNPNTDPYTKDCSKTEGGGGLMEKLARYRRLREYALELQDDVGKKTKKKALEELVEEMWNAPLVRKGILPKLMAEKRWNIPNEAFPMPPAAAPEPEIDMAALPDIKKSADEGGPSELIQGEDSLRVAFEAGPVIKFYHKQTTGANKGQIFDHANKCVSVEGLEGFIRAMNPVYRDDRGFGLCCLFPGDCNGRLYPEEIEPYFVDADDEEHDAELKALFSEYKMKFNWKFRARAGGRRKTRKQRKTRRRFGGGNNNIGNVFVPATNAKCSIRPRNKTMKQSNK